MDNKERIFNILFTCGMILYIIALSVGLIREINHLPVVFGFVTGLSSALFAIILALKAEVTDLKKRLEAMETLKKAA